MPDLATKLAADSSNGGYTLGMVTASQPQPARRTTAMSRHFGSPSSRTVHTLASRFSRSTAPATRPQASSPTSVHVVAAVSENLARETAVASVDAGQPSSLTIVKQANGQAYNETLNYLTMLDPDEILLNEGRRQSPLVRKILELYEEAAPTKSHKKRPRQGGDEAPSATVVKFVSRACFDQTRGATLLQRIAREETYDRSLVEEYIMLSSAHAVLAYVQQSLGAVMANKTVDLLINSGGTGRMAMDRTTLWQLELLVNSKTGKAPNSLIGSLAAPKTSVGSRFLRSNLMAPPTQLDTIQTRLELVDSFLQSSDFFYSVLEHLTQLPDIQHMLGNICLIPKSMEISQDDPPDRLVRLASKGIAALISIKTVLSSLPSLIGVLEQHLQELSADDADTVEDTATAVTDRTSLWIGMGDRRRQGRAVHGRHHLLKAILFAMKHPELNEMLSSINAVFTDHTTFSRNANAREHQECFALEDKEEGIMTILRQTYLNNVDDIYKNADAIAEAYGMRVTVKYTTTRGYYLSVPMSHAPDLPEEFLHPTKNGRTINFTTNEVASFNLRARDNVRDLLVLTHERTQEVMDTARSHYDAMAALGDAIALLDMCHSFADTVSLSSEPWCRPIITDPGRRSAWVDSTATADDTSSTAESSATLMIRNGRYGIDVSELHLGAEDGPTSFIPNDTYGKHFTLITGINGSGKSTYLKQIAIIVVLAHCGCYVPAEQAFIPIRDRLCTRIGNADDQEHNISTFMLEMRETAFICNSATEKSLMLLDELGRATSNEDGVAIAWSVSEYLLKRQAMTFFVTHYPQLTRLGDFYPTVQNAHLEASVTDGDEGTIAYSHKIKAGSCKVSDSYGVELSAACGWTADTFEEARAIEKEVQERLPGDSLHQTQEEMNTQTLAFQKLTDVAQAAKRIASSDQYDSVDDLRKALVREQAAILEDTDEEMLDCMERLLSRDYRRQMQQHAVDQEVDDPSAWADAAGIAERTPAEENIRQHRDKHGRHFEGSQSSIAQNSRGNHTLSHASVSTDRAAGYSSSSSSSSSSTSSSSSSGSSSSSLTDAADSLA